MTEARESQLKAQNGLSLQPSMGKTLRSLASSRIFCEGGVFRHTARQSTIVIRIGLNRVYHRVNTDHIHTYSIASIHRV